MRAPGGMGSLWLWLLAGMGLAIDLDPAAAQPGRCPEVVPGQSQVVVHVRPAGLFAGRLHEHHFVPTRWSGRVCFDPERPGEVDLELTFEADSLEDRQPELSPEDIETVERQVRGPEVLDAATYPVIRYRGERLTVDTHDRKRLEGTLHGELSLHGQTRRLQVPLTARWTDDHLRATGIVDFNQSDFGIEPYSRFLGTVSVQDRVSIEFAIDAER